MKIVDRAIDEMIIIGKVKINHNTSRIYPDEIQGDRRYYNDLNFTSYNQIPVVLVC